MLITFNREACCSEHTASNTNLHKCAIATECCNAVDNIQGDTEQGYKCFILTKINQYIFVTFIFLHLGPFKYFISLSLFLINAKLLTDVCACMLMCLCMRDGQGEEGLSVHMDPYY
jgi:hypothetical protein